MPDKDRVKGPVQHPESTVEEGVGTLKDDEAKRDGGGAPKGGGKAQGGVGSEKTDSSTRRN